MRDRWGFLPLRAVVGVTFIMHGGLKLFSMGIPGTTRMMAGMGIPLPGIAAVGVIAVEMIAGLAILLGAFTRAAAVLLACDMIGVILFAKLHGGFFAPRGSELELALLGACLTLAAVGPGGFSVDGAQKGRGA